jgi:MFS family permease
LMSFGAGVNNPSITGLLSRSSSLDEQGGIMGIAQSTSSLARVLGPVWGGYTFGSIGIRWPFISAGLLMGLAFLISVKRLLTEEALPVVIKS